jgi:hypothetical protein
MALHLGDYGFAITIIMTEGGTAKDISTASTKQFVFKKPDASTATKTAIFTTDGTNGSLYYTVETGFLNQIGAWQVQAVATFAAALWHSDVATFNVTENL